MARRRQYEKAWQWESETVKALPQVPFMRDEKVRNSAIRYFAIMRTVPWGTRMQQHQSCETLEQRFTRAIPKRLRQEDSPLHSSSWPDMEQPLKHLTRLRRGTEFHGFMSLPREIRHMIYTYLVAPGIVVVPNGDKDGLTLGHKYTLNEWSDSYERYRNLAPEWYDEENLNNPGYGTSLQALFGVSRRFHIEVSRVFYGENRFIFPAGEWQWPAYLNDGRLPTILSRYMKEAYKASISIRDASYAFDMRDATISDLQHVKRLWSTGRLQDRLQPPPQQEYLQHWHDSRLELLQEKWSDRMVSIKKMSLRRLQIAFDECYCGLGCCRQVEWVCRTLSNLEEQWHLWDDGQRWHMSWKSEGRWGTEDVYAPRVIDIFGWKDKEEKTLIKEQLASLKEVGTREINFIGKSLWQCQDEMLHPPNLP